GIFPPGPPQSVGGRTGASGNGDFVAVLSLSSLPRTAERSSAVRSNERLRIRVVLRRRAD
ncbi:MAG: hypothetical protein AAF804_17160, partial [Bacteroidota bacterium]